MQKRSFLVLAVFVAAVPAFAQQNVRDFAVRANVIDGVNGVTIVGYFGSTKNVIIPQAIDGLPVTSIGEQAFMMRGLTSVSIPNGVLVIGRQAFYGNQLRNILIPSSVRTIGEAAFDNNQYINVQRTARSNSTTVVERSPVRRRESVVREVLVPPSPASGRAEQAAAVEEKAPPPAPPLPVASTSLDAAPTAAPSTEKESRHFVLLENSGKSREVLVYDYEDGNLRETVFVEKSAPPPTPGNAQAADGFTASAGPEHPTRVTITEKNSAPVRAAGKPAPESSHNFQAPNPASNLVTTRVEDAGPVTPTIAQMMPPPPVRPPVDQGTFFVQNNGDGTATVVGYRGQYNFVSIPRSIGGLRLTIIASSAFYQRRLVRAYIPETVAHIADGAFAGNSMSEVTLPESVRYVGYQAFAGNDLMKITIGTGVNVQPDSVRNQFSEFYNLHGQLGGTYIWHEGAWTYSNLDDVRYYYDH